ncbi:hypothetical protein SDC9_178519 [bioreactor metagenome]|uniref:Uncharacterized protein n=1 Tax=bioreactor metagenome TaxID=1076179 RepID=A0A645GW66_9ZZZZ
MKRNGVKRGLVCLVAAVLLGGVALLLFQYGIVAIRFKGADRYTLLIVWFLEAVGLAFQYRLSPQQAVHTLVMMAIAMVAMLCAMVFYVWDAVKKLNRGTEA